MSDVITEQDKEYEAREEAAAPGSDQPMGDRVNNRSLRPRSEAFVEFMSSGWDDNEPAIERLASAEFTPARLQTLSEAFPGERLVIPAGQPKVRNNDCDYAFRPDSAFSYYTGLGQDYEAGAVLVLDPNADGTHTPMLFVAPRADHYTQDFFKDPHYGEYWVGPRAGLKELKAMTGIETHDIAQLADMLGKNVGTEPGAVQLRVISATDPQITAMVQELRAEHGFPDEVHNTVHDDKLHEFASEARMEKDGFEVREIRRAVDATKHGFDNILRKLPSALASRVPSASSKARSTRSRARKAMRSATTRSSRPARTHRSCTGSATPAP